VSLSAVTLHVTDMERSFAFYRALGFPVHYGGPTATFSSLEVGADAYLNLQLVDAAPGVGWGRVIIHVPDVDAVHRAALEAGLTPDADPADATWGERYFHIGDPDGHEISIARYL
jgi:catechol 2,3-dioxygenase-like lactoylglutathione lyase family enzyme